MSPFMIAHITATQGSSPRECGAFMLISSQDTLGTIGGGKLEYAVITQARQLLQQRQPTKTDQTHTAQLVEETFTLGPTLGQCCGGTVSIRYEWCHDSQRWQHPDQLARTNFPIMLFGAGHVGTALSRILTTLPCQLHWLDNRPGIFPSGLPDGVHCYHDADPVARVAELPQNGYYLVMTHDHALDLELCEHILLRNDARFVGLIGSKTKLARFSHQLLKRGLSQTDIARIHCPIGIPQIHGKQPAHIALAVAAQLLTLYEQAAPEAST